MQQDVIKNNPGSQNSHHLQSRKLHQIILKAKTDPSVINQIKKKNRETLYFVIHSQ